MEPWMVFAFFLSGLTGFSLAHPYHSASLINAHNTALRNSGDMKCERNVLIEIHNNLKNWYLAFDGEYIFSGANRIPCTSRIYPGQMEVCGYSKRHYSMAGSCGVTRYTVRGLSKYLNIDLIYENGYITATRFGLHIGEAEAGGSPNDVWSSYYHHYMWNGLQKEKLRWSPAGWEQIRVQHDGVEVTAAMSVGDRVVMKVEVGEKDVRR